MTSSQPEVDLLLPLGDHQHTTRVVLAHDFQDATYVRQSLDYAQFGRVTATLGANGLADSSGVVTAFAHHGSLLDAATGLQRKGERWYSPDLGRFVSEDPIQDGSNWYAFAGNDPVNFADPSGLSQQGHPLGGGYSGNVTRQPTIRPGNIPANALSTIGTPLGHAVSRGHGTRSEPAPVARPSSKPLTINDFNYSKDLSSITRTVDPLKAMVQQQRTIDAYRADQALSALRGAHAAELTDIAERNAVRRTVRNYEQGIGQVFLGYGDAIAGTAEGLYNVVRHPINTITGVASAVAHPIRTVQAIASDFHEKSGSLRGQGAIFGEILTGFATGGAAKIAKETGLLGRIAGKLLEREGTASSVSDEFAEGAATRVKFQGDRVYALQPSNGGTGPPRWTRMNRQTSASTHGNALSNPADTHVYVIRDPLGRPLRIGESAQGMRVRDGASIRAEQQVRDLIREHGPGYTSEIRKTLPGKAAARTYETNFIERYRRMFGDDQLPGNKTNR